MLHDILTQILNNLGKLELKIRLVLFFIFLSTEFL